MTQFAPEDLLLFLYKETTPEKTSAIETALENDWTLREKLAVLQASHARLQTLVTAPRPACVHNILQYATQTERTPSK